MTININGVRYPFRYMRDGSCAIDTGKVIFVGYDVSELKMRVETYLRENKE